MSQRAKRFLCSVFVILLISGMLPAQSENNQVFSIGNLEVRPGEMVSGYLGNTAVLMGKPAITTESGYLGGTDEIDIQRNVHGVLNVMRYFNLLKGDPSQPEETVWIDKYEVVYSDSDGLFYPLTEMGYYVQKGEKVGYIADYLGKTVQEFKAPFTGMLLYIINTPPISKGEPVFEVGRIKE
jgi:predicted deacylase